jgi:xylulokinase
MSVPFFLGLDSSTQSLKATVIDPTLNVVAEFAVTFDTDLPEFKTEGGVHRSVDGLTVTSPPLMWVAALDLLFSRMKAGGFEFDRVVAVSGSGQQHGSVYLRRGARAALNGLRPDAPLRKQLKDVFAIEASPVWMDASTTLQCQALEAALGGAQAVAELTGSRAYERFTGNQIARIVATQHAGYEASERIALVSSFMASLLIGDYAPIDVSDGSGMNLLDIRRATWAQRALDATAPGLGARLGTPVASHTLIGPLHAHFVGRYGFRPSCQVIAFSGDNPCSLAGLRLQQAGDVAISLGTSDTMFGALREPKPSASEGHIFVSPVDPQGYMAMIVYRNGSLTREAIRNAAASGSWDRFDTLLAETAPGNGGHIGFYFKEPEITPPVLKPGMHRFGPDGHAVKTFAPAVEVRAVVEAQFLSMRLHSSHVGLTPTRILATGGASANHAILRIMADVFGVPVFTARQPGSAALGAAYRALHGWTCADQRRFVPFADIMQAAPPLTRTAEPNGKAHAVYGEMLKSFARLEQTLL